MDKSIIPKISVLMPVYNCRQFIEESVNSILTQTFTDFEFIIVDDCSTDGTFEYLQSLSDNRIIIIRKPQNTGLAISLNIGLEIAKGIYIARMDGDDISFVDRFAKQVAFMDANLDVIVCGGGYEAIGAADFKFVPKSLNEDIILDMIDFSPIAHPTAFLRSTIIKKNNIQYFPEFVPAEDYKMWTILSEYGKLANLKDILLYYRIHENQTSTNKTYAQKEIVKLIAFDYIKTLSKNNEYSNFFCRIKLKTVEDLKKYENVEADIKSTFNERGVRINDKFFLERKRQYIKQSLIQNRYSIPQVLKDSKLIFRCCLILDKKFVIRYIIKSIIYWGFFTKNRNEVN